MKRRLVLAGASAAILGLGWRRFQRLSEPDVAATDLPLHTSLQRGITKYLQVGDILFRGRDDSWGELGALISRRDQRYGHVGVMTRHNDAWAVVSATGNPLDREGHVQREPLNAFIGYSTRLGLYRPQLQAEQIIDFVAILDGHLAASTPFDRAYDTDDAGAVYCTELIWRSLNDVMNSDVIPDKTNWRGRSVIALDDLQHATILRSVRHLDVADKDLA